MDADRAAQLARIVGSNPWLVLAAVAAIAVVALVVLLTVGRFIHSRRESIWRRAVAGWGELVQRTPFRQLRSRFPGAWRVLGRLTANEYLLLHLVLGLVASGGVLLFASLAESVAGEAAIARFDRALADALHAGATPEGVRAFRAFTALGAGLGLTIVASFVALWLLSRRETILAVGWSLGMIGVGALNWGLKAIYRRGRPEFDAPWIESTGWSFPSGHSMSTYVACALGAYLVIVLTKSSRAHVIAASLALVWAVAMGFSRMYLGVHYLSDVVAGFAAGTVWAAACISGMEVARRRRARRKSRAALETA